MRYIFAAQKRKNSQLDLSNLRAMSQRRPPPDLMRRALADTIEMTFRRLHAGEPMSSEEARVRYDDALDVQVKKHLLGSVDAGQLARLREQGHARLNALGGVPLFDALEGREWMPLKTARPSIQPGLALWNVPQLIRREGATWHLYRFQMEAHAARPSPSQRIELGLLIDWATRQEMLPADASAYVVHRIAWRWNRWVTWTSPGKARWVEEARRLLSADVGAIRDIQFDVREWGDLAALPGPRSRRMCRTCAFAQVCDISTLNQRARAKVKRDRATAK